MVRTEYVAMVRTEYVAIVSTYKFVSTDYVTRY